ncbi:FeoB small GTPase domain-containing protein, partial [Psychrobacter sp. HY3-MNA-CIBAN-0198]
YLTTQLRELGIPIIVVINKIDAAKKLGININVDDMSVRLGCPVVAICSRNQADVEQLQAELMSLLEKGDSVQSLMLQYHTDIEASVT